MQLVVTSLCGWSKEDVQERRDDTIGEGERPTSTAGEAEKPEEQAKAWQCPAIGTKKYRRQHPRGYKDLAMAADDGRTGSRPA